MSKPTCKSIAIVVIATLTCFFACDIAFAKHRASPPEATQPVGEAVAYEALEQHVGAEILIETTFNTVRRGTLLKYTNPALTLQLGPEHGSVELTVPRDTVRGVRIVPTAADGANVAKPDAG